MLRLRCCVQSTSSGLLVEYSTLQEATNAYGYLHDQPLCGQPLQLSISESAERLSFERHSRETIGAISQMLVENNDEQKVSPDMHVQLHSLSAMQPSATLRAHRVPAHINAAELADVLGQHRR